VYIGSIRVDKIESDIGVRITITEVLFRYGYEVPPGFPGRESREYQVQGIGTGAQSS
jgi:hypothetical protein